MSRLQLEDKGTSAGWVDLDTQQSFEANTLRLNQPQYATHALTAIRPAISTPSRQRGRPVPIIDKPNPSSAAGSKRKKSKPADWKAHGRTPHRGLSVTSRYVPAHGLDPFAKYKNKQRYPILLTTMDGTSCELNMIVDQSTPDTIISQDKAHYHFAEQIVPLPPRGGFQDVHPLLPNDGMSGCIIKNTIRSGRAKLEKHTAVNVIYVSNMEFPEEVNFDVICGRNAFQRFRSESLCSFPRETDDRDSNKRRKPSSVATGEPVKPRNRRVKRLSTAGAPSRTGPLPMDNIPNPENVQPNFVVPNTASSWETPRLTMEFDHRQRQSYQLPFMGSGGFQFGQNSYPDLNLIYPDDTGNSNDNNNNHRGFDDPILGLNEGLGDLSGLPHSTVYENTGNQTVEFSCSLQDYTTYNDPLALDDSMGSTSQGYGPAPSQNLSESELMITFPIENGGPFEQWLNYPNNGRCFNGFERQT